ncbi:hypothetical protein Salat_0399100 [Sesamum alatum]|uniref:Uncharacterized protein n=1 Tax=Sesamum alatum TaxID=300844 RepID=A0AAE2CZQ7_9LAMI|nr:hypothetical protein Salat_0399100 [Sesamum alatum]
MASVGGCGENFRRSLDSRGRSTAEVLFGKILGTVSAAAAAPGSMGKPPAHFCQDEDVAGEKRGLLGIDLNVAPPEDDGPESPAAENGVNEVEIRAAAAAAVASGEKAGSGDGNELNFDGIAEVVDDAHWSNGEPNGFVVLEEEVKHSSTVKIATDSDVKLREEKERRNRRLNALLEVAENSLRDYEENLRNREEKVQNRKRKAGGEADRKKLSGNRRQSFGQAWNDGCELAAAEAKVLAPPPVVRSTRGRAVAMPNKYRDSVLDAVAEFPRHNKSGKSATVVSAQRKSR